MIEGEETCDPPNTCPTSCNDGEACTDDTLVGEIEECTAACPFPEITACINDDGCCPSLCEIGSDNDCNFE
ncbi:MAG: hypothetical protein JXA30_01515 [Deltaproteobacteria bacterium]|nr:hypothetical protein [Deltaproteobacteria bacterium]